MNAAGLRRGDVFVEAEPAEYAQLSQARRSKLRRYTVKHDAEPCRAGADRVHVRLEGANWCIPAVAPVVLVEAQAKRQENAA
jgi:hypothetical protein